jgi:hypothetical protein
MGFSCIFNIVIRCELLYGRYSVSFHIWKTGCLGINIVCLSEATSVSTNYRCNELALKQGNVLTTACSGPTYFKLFYIVQLPFIVIRCELLYGRYSVSFHIWKDTVEFY